jgi:GNAT superfamily N-acetyltransferase
MAVSLRCAEPSDVENVARIMDLSGRQQLVCESFVGEQKEPCWAFMFPLPEEERLEKIGWLFLNADRLSTHYSRFKVAEIDGKIAGGLSIYTEECDKIPLWIKTWRKMGYSTIEIAAILWRALPYIRAHPSTLEKTLVVDFVATLPDYQRRGVITALLEDAIEKARNEGFPRIQVVTFIGNVSAKGAYEKVGFRVDKEITKRSHEKLYGSPGKIRLVNKL